MDVVEGVKDCVVFRDGDGGTWRSAPMEPEERQVMEESPEMSPCG